MCGKPHLPHSRIRYGGGTHGAGTGKEERYPAGNGPGRRLQNRGGNMYFSRLSTDTWEVLFRCAFPQKVV